MYSEFPGNGWSLAFLIRRLMHPSAYSNFRLQMANTKQMQHSLQITKLCMLPATDSIFRSCESTKCLSLQISVWMCSIHTETHTTYLKCSPHTVNQSSSVTDTRQEGNESTLGLTKFTFSSIMLPIWFKKKKYQFASMVFYLLLSPLTVHSHT